MDTTTSPALRIGFMAGGSTRAAVQALEAEPIDSLWVGGHLASPNPGPEALGSLARLGALAERVRVGTSILLLPLYPPAIVAKVVADIDIATSGRVIFGIGVGGEYPQEFHAVGVPVTERGKRADEAIALLRALWSGGPVTHEGRFFSMADVRLHPPPVQPGGPPIVVAGRQPAAMRRAALLGDGWMPYLYSPRRYAASVETITTLATEAGRSLDGFEWFAFVFVNANPDGEVARSEAAAFLGGTYHQDFDAMLGSVAAVGTPEEVTERLQAYVDAGARHLIFTPATRSDAAGIRRRLIDDIVPRLMLTR